MANSSTSSSLPPSPSSLRQDAGVIGLVGGAHLMSHFNQLLLAPLFPWLKGAFDVSYTELGFLMTIFFVVSCVVQAASGFVVDRLGPRPILFIGLALLGMAAFGYAMSTSYAMLAGFAVVGGLGNGVFHPVDYTLLNRKVSTSRLGHAYSVHGITGSLGWALAPALLVPLTLAFSWRVALMSAGALTWLVLVVLLVYRAKLHLPVVVANPTSPAAGAASAQSTEGDFAFLRLPAVWMCFGFFFFYALSLSVVQAFAPEAARQLHDMPLSLVATCLTAYMLASSGGMVLGGFLVSNPDRCERIVGVGFGMAACFALVLGLAQVPGWAVPVLFGLMGFAAGTGGPSRDLIVKRATPANSTGRVYGVVYAGLDIGQAVSPLIFGALMDGQRYQSVFLGLALVQAVLIASAFNVRRVRRHSMVAA